MKSYGVVLDLCSGSGNWSRPFAEAGFDVIEVDIKNGQDVRCFELSSHYKVWGILAAPPCTEYAASGARWWANKPPHLLVLANQVVRACLHQINTHKPVWWALENPPGRINTAVPELGRVAFTFQPYEYGDAWCKSTRIWGTVKKPPVTASEKFMELTRELRGTMLDVSPWRMSPSAERSALRAETPPEFAKAFYKQVTEQFA